MYYENYKDFVTDENWNEGYHRSEKMIALARSSVSENLANNASSIEFENGGIVQIEKTELSDWFVNFIIDTEKILSPENNGSLDNAKFFDANLKELPTKSYYNNGSQFGLQGKIFGKILLLLGYKNGIRISHILCAGATALVWH